MEEMDHLLENTQPFIGHQEEWRHPVETLLNLSVEYTVFVSLHMSIVCTYIRI